MAKRKNNSNNLKVPKKAGNKGKGTPPVPGAIVSDTNLLVQFDFTDFDDVFWPRTDGGGDCFVSIGRNIKELNSLTWGIVRERKFHHHSIVVWKLTNDAQNRLNELGFGDLEEVFSFRLTPKNRIIGRKVGSTLFVLWWDPDHKVCPSEKKHT